MLLASLRAPSPNSKYQIVKETLVSFLVLTPPWLIQVEEVPDNFMFFMSEEHSEHNVKLHYKPK
jgi:hypothetical protein